MRFDAGVHNAVPVLACEHLKDGKQRLYERVEIGAWLLDAFEVEFAA